MTPGDAMSVATQALATGTRPADVMTEAEFLHGEARNSIVELDAADMQEHIAHESRRARLAETVVQAAQAWNAAGNEGDVHEVLVRIATANDALRAALDALNEHDRSES